MRCFSVIGHLSEHAALGRHGGLASMSDRPTDCWCAYLHYGHKCEYTVGDSNPDGSPIWGSWRVLELGECPYSRGNDEQKRCPISTVNLDFIDPSG